MNDQYDYVTSVEQQLDGQGPLSNDVGVLEDQYNNMKVGGKLKLTSCWGAYDVNGPCP